MSERVRQSGKDHRHSENDRYRSKDPAPRRDERRHGYDRDKSRSPERRWDDHGRHSRYPLDTYYSKRSESKDRFGKRYALDESDGDGEWRRSHHSRHGYERGRSTSPLRKSRSHRSRTPSVNESSSSEESVGHSTHSRHRSRSHLPENTKRRHSPSRSPSRNRDQSRSRHGHRFRGKDKDRGGERDKGRKEEKERRRKKRKDKERRKEKEERRSILTGKKIKLKVHKDAGDDERDANRQDLLKFLNSAFE